MRELLLLIIFLLFSFQSFAEVKIIEVRHRAPADLEAQVREILDDGEKVKAAGSHLVLVADGESLKAAVQMIVLLDLPQKNLLIRVRQSDELQQTGKDASASVYYTNGSGLLSSSTSGYRAGNSTSTREQTLQLLAGGRGLIEVGREIPFTEQWSAVTGDITGYAETTAYKTIATGFWVYPIQVLSDKVLVDIEPYISNATQAGAQAPPQIDYSQLRTRLHVPIGQWYPLGGELLHRDKVSRAIISWRSSDQQSDRQLHIRIDLGE